ncbi:MAG: DNA-directed RNA polymerase subunit beta', partial [Lachnospiraceae bacterium]|nr:DNA-directed RNA polymerase subunit beta' [Lachnospiraceae bacterium]
AETKVDKYERAFRSGLISNQERYEKVVEIWNDATDEVADALMDSLAPLNNLQIMAHSGARGSKNQIRQVGGMRGLMANATGKTVEVPIKSNFREGLSILEYFISSNGARKGLADTALRTADSGYLTRRMVDVSQQLVIQEEDCSVGREEIPGMTVKAFMDGKETIEKLKDRITGRTTCVDIFDKDGNMIVKHNHMITPARAERIMKEGVNDKGEPIDKLRIRTILTCRCKNGICAKCYGANMATGEKVQIGEAVGIIAAQSIGEPGTQLTMRTFHTGGVAGSDITQGLPRVEELFEARKPKGLAIISEIDGKVTKIEEIKRSRKIFIENEETGEKRDYLTKYGSSLKVEEGQIIEAGDYLTEGSIDPHDLLKIKGIRAVQDYLLKEVQRVYRLQGVDIADKHIEVLVRQMLRKIRIDEPGDTELLSGTQIDKLDFEEINEQLIAEGKAPIEGTQIILGITKAALATDSFMSAASFQETTKVLTDAAIKGKTDPLIGLKENVIIGKLIPAGTGLKRYRNLTLSTDLNNKNSLNEAENAEEVFEAAEAVSEDSDSEE